VRSRALTAHEEPVYVQLPAEQTRWAIIDRTVMAELRALKPDAGAHTYETGGAKVVRAVLPLNPESGGDTAGADFFGFAIHGVLDEGRAFRARAAGRLSGEHVAFPRSLYLHCGLAARVLVARVRCSGVAARRLTSGTGSGDPAVTTETREPAGPRSGPGASGASIVAVHGAAATRSDSGKNHQAKEPHVVSSLARAAHRANRTAR
jgi:hypothetical protein